MILIQLLTWVSCDTSTTVTDSAARDTVTTVTTDLASRDTVTPVENNVVK